MARQFQFSLSVFFLVMISFFPVAKADPQFSLVGAVKYALEYNDELRAMSFALAAGKENIGIAESSFSPQVSFEERAMRTNNPGYVLSLKMDQHRFSGQDLSGAPSTFNEPGSNNDFQSTVSFEQPLFARKADLGIVMARQEYAAQTADYRRKKQEVALKVVQSYLAVQTAAQYIIANEKNLEDAKEHFRIAASRNKAGLGLYSDMLRAGTAVTDAEQRLVSSQKNFKVATRQLGLIIGIDGSADIAGVTTVPSAVKPIDYYNSAALVRPDILSLEIRYKNAQTNSELAQAGYLPTLGIGGAYQMNDRNRVLGSEGESWQIMAFLRWNIFDGNKSVNEVKKAKLILQEAGESLRGVKKAVLFKIYDAYLSVDEAAKNVELARASTASAEEGKRLIEMRYNASLSPIVDLLDAQVNLDNARATLVARENALQLAVAVLDFESGTILQSLAVE
ncbi:MAG: TolC family protein [Negativicutes bacterium]|nr:TolC family protein [Negativicutes bacterium]